MSNIKNENGTTISDHIGCNLNKIGVDQVIVKLGTFCVFVMFNVIGY